ncbi:uncharacterized protein LOC134668615 [Cydia fagiglandana]|uniref:uncharacterized protein LOC134668615 n=1 Tax=Cydia fagiglandana TaxID=1458189 RepID=UPI002FEE63F3
MNAEEYVTYERFYTLNKQSTSESCVMATSRSSVFYDLDSVAKRNSYSYSAIGLSTFNIFRALNSKGNEWPRAPESVHIVQECTTHIKSNLNTCDEKEEYLNTEKNDFLRECGRSSGICLKDSIEDTESSSDPNGPQITHSMDTNTRIRNHITYQTEQLKVEGHKTRKKDHDKRIKDSYLTSHTATKVKTSESVVATTATYKEKVITNMSSMNKTHLKMEEKLTCMSGDGLGEKYTANLSKHDPSCIIILDEYDIAKMSHSQISDSRKSRARLVNVVTNKIRVKPKKVRAVRCPNCHGHIELAVSIEDEASTRVQSKTDRKSETEFTYMAASKDTYHPIIEIPKECPHGCEMVPLCQILPKVNFDASSIKQNIRTKTTTPRYIKMTKACRHYPPCTAIPSCQRNNVIKANYECIPPCSHNPRCVNLPLCISFCKNMQYDETRKHYVDREEISKNRYIPAFQYLPVSQYKLLQPHIISQKPAFHRQPYHVDQTHLSCQVSPLNTKQLGIATKSCQYDYPKHEPNYAPKVDATNASVIYIRDVGCQFKNSSFTPPHTSYYQTRVCYTSSASFDPGSKRLDNIYTNPKAFTCETLPIDAKSKAKCKSSTILSSSSSSVTMTRDLSVKPSSKTNTAAFCMLRNGEGGYVVPVKSKRSALKGKCKNKFTIQRRQISKVLSNLWCRKQV